MGKTATCYAHLHAGCDNAPLDTLQLTRLFFPFPDTIFTAVCGAGGGAVLLFCRLLAHAPACSHEKTGYLLDDDLFLHLHDFGNFHHPVHRHLQSRNGERATASERRMRIGLSAGACAHGLSTDLDYSVNRDNLFDRHLSRTHRSAARRCWTRHA